METKITNGHARIVRLIFFLGGLFALWLALFILRVVPVPRDYYSDPMIWSALVIVRMALMGGVLASTILVIIVIFTPTREIRALIEKDD